MTVTVRGVSQEEYDAALSPPSRRRARKRPAARRPGAPCPPSRWPDSSSPPNTATRRPSSPSGTPATRTIFPATAATPFDILLDSARAAVSPDARDAYLHDGEAILLNDAPVIPLYYLGGSYQLRDGLTGLYRAPDGVYFLSAVAEAS